jgi:hypothetical protein
MPKSPLRRLAFQILARWLGAEDLRLLAGKFVLYPSEFVVDFVDYQNSLIPAKEKGVNAILCGFHQHGSDQTCPTAGKQM